MRFEGGNPTKGNGIVFRGSEKGFYLFDLSPNGFYALYKYDGDFKSIQDKTLIPNVETYGENRIDVEVRGDIVRLLVNGERVKSINIDNRLDSGFVGLYVCAGSWVSFDNYWIEVND